MSMTSYKYLQFLQRELVWFQMRMFVYKDIGNFTIWSFIPYTMSNAIVVFAQIPVF
jgi:hypothetical protein